MRGETEIVEPVLYFRKGEHLITDREMAILQAVCDTGSQNKAAGLLGLSVPVLNKRLKGMEKKLDEKLVASTSLHTRLTPQGMALLESRRKYTERLIDEQSTLIGATPILQEQLRKLMPPDMMLLISNDEHNVRMFLRGEMNLLVLDDPEYILDLSDKEYKGLLGNIIQIGQDKLLHFRKGSEYIRYGYGAQRLGFRYLKTSQIDHSEVEKTLDIGTLFGSEMSFFINKSLFETYKASGVLGQEMTAGFEMEELLEHSLNAVTRWEKGGPPQEIEVLLKDLARVLK